MSKSKQYKHRVWSSAELNNTTFDYYYNFLKSITINRIELIGLPSTVDERFILRGLFERGKMLWLQEPALVGDDGGPADLCLNFNTGGQLTFYDIPILRQAYTTNGQYNTMRTAKDSVIIWNNYSHLPDAPTATMYARRLADIQRTIDVNVMGQKTPKIITCTENQQLTMRNLFMQWSGNEPFIFGDSKMLQDIRPEVLDTTAPYVVDKLEIEKHMLMNEYMTQIGISNSNQDKKERLVSAEVNSNSDLVENARNITLNSYRQAFDKINDMFGHNIEVRFRTNVEKAEYTETDIDTGGDE